MDLGTIIGIGLALTAVFGSMLLEGGNPMTIILIPPMFLVFAGTFGAAMATGSMKDATGIVKWFKVALMSKPVEGGKMVDTIVQLAETARREGLLALEDAVRKVEDPFLRKGLELAIDGTDSEDLREILESEIAAKRINDRAGAKIFSDMGGYAPTIGILGTVLGLVHVLGNLSNPSELGKLIAGAFVATLWGVMTANVFWLPMAGKLRRVSDLECQQMELLLEGVTAIQAGANPRMVARKLRSLLPPNERLAAGAKTASGKPDQGKAAQGKVA
ncbi:MAG TPA: flagellar motor protein [Candidatus Nanopelagicaceae bacterium]|nr:flagellar motor protein [Candidatus Nanopelagicaceae bacterium]